MCVENIYKNILVLYLELICIITDTFAAGGQLLNSTYFPNPAELATTNKFEISGGNIFFNPELTFKGRSQGQTGIANSNEFDPIPFLYAAYRVNEQLVVGLNLIPSVYSDVKWGVNQITQYSSTKTNVLYYRFGMQASYQLTHKLSVGIGGNLERNSLETNFMVPGLGKEINQVVSYNYNFDMGLYYKINDQTSLTLAGYSPIYRLAEGTSRLLNVVNNHYRALNVDASLAYLGINHHVNEKWILDGKIFFSNWSRLKKLYFLNTVTGSSVLPTYWKNIWSFQVANDYFVTNKLSLIGQVLYETNPVTPQRNYIGFPLSSAISLTAGLGYFPSKPYSIKLLYNYGTFLPKARIDTKGTQGTVSANIETLTLQAYYKI